MANISLVSRILLLSNLPKGSSNKLVKHDKLEKYLPYCTRNSELNYNKTKQNKITLTLIKKGLPSVINC